MAQKPIHILIVERPYEPPESEPLLPPRFLPMCPEAACQSSATPEPPPARKYALLPG